MVNSFKQALHLSVATAEDHDVVSVGEVGHMDVGSNLNPWVIPSIMQLKRVGERAHPCRTPERISFSLHLGRRVVYVPWWVAHTGILYQMCYVCGAIYGENTSCDCYPFSL